MQLGDVPVSFNKRLLKTAGICKYTVTRTNKNKQACVELSEKVCDSAGWFLISTLCNSMSMVFVLGSYLLMCHCRES